ncbi:MAG: lamin tail domain-containing protein [Patescibacteria group bacterium]|mgnify:CR=1 FL=1
MNKFNYLKFVLSFLAVILIVSLFVPFSSSAKFWNQLKETTSNVLSAVKSVIKSDRVDFKQIEQIDLSDVENKVTEQKSEKAVANSKGKNSTEEDIKELKNEIKLLKKEISSLKSKSGDKSDDKEITSEASENSIVKKSSTGGELSFCKFSTSQKPQHQGVIINEIAWMGSTKSTADEWIELKNISNSDVNLIDWQLISKDGQIKINLSELKNSNSVANSYILFERTDDNSVLGIAADLIYKGGLSNTSEKLRLFDSSCNLIDEVSASSNWSAGDSVSKKTMERNTDGSSQSLSNQFGWHTSSVINGTPKAANSEQQIVYSGGGGGGGVAVAQNNVSPQNTASSPQFFDVAINEIMYNPDGNDDGREWIEIFNKSSSTVDLTEWKFFESDTNHGLTLKNGSKNLEPNFYAIISNDSDKFSLEFPEFSGTIFISSFSLNNSSGTIALKNGDLKINEVNYTSSTGAYDNGKSLQLFDDVWEESSSTPGQANKLDVVDNWLNAKFSFSPASPQLGEDIIFDASSSIASNGNIVLYQWDFGDGVLATSTQATTTYSYATSTDYTVWLTVFDNNGSSTASSTILVISVSTSTQTVNYILISEIQVKGESADDEFIELYNPTENIVFLNDYSIQYLSGVATSTENIKKKNFESSAQIPVKGFYLIVNSNATSSLKNKADMIHSSFDLSGSSSGATIFLVSTTTPILSINDSTIIDSLSYGSPQLTVGVASSTVPDSNRSLERKSFLNSTCVSAQNDNEFLGNGCDTDSDSDFEIRAISNPQNFLSSPEPNQ